MVLLLLGLISKFATNTAAVFAAVFLYSRIIYIFNGCEFTQYSKLLAICRETFSHVYLSAKRFIGIPCRKTVPYKDIVQFDDTYSASSIHYLFRRFRRDARPFAFIGSSNRTCYIISKLIF